MFAKLARFNGFGRRHALLSAAKTAHANDNHPVRRVTAASPRTRRQILVCGWRQVPATGRLECFWQVEPAGAAVAEEPGISRLTHRRSSAGRRIFSDRLRVNVGARCGRYNVRGGLNNIQR
jgi:hypothetical protein